MIALIDYGAGNLRSVQNTLDVIGTSYTVTDDAAVVAKADRLILPGVGHFGQMTDALDRLRLRDVLLDQIRTGVPFFGICVGLQALFEESEESPGKRGLGIFPGAIRRFAGEGRVPHMGWNSLDRQRSSKLMSDLDEHPFTYFAHSYYAPVVEATSFTCTYMQPYSAVLEQGNVYAVQFHPEKSGATGLQVMKNFLRI